MRRFWVGLRAGRNVPAAIAQGCAGHTPSLCVLVHTEGAHGDAPCFLARSFPLTTGDMSVLPGYC